MNKRRRPRTRTLESEIRESARQIHVTGLQEAMKAAAYMVVARKLDEIKSILQGVGISDSIPKVSQFSGVQPSSNGTGMRIEPGPIVQHACTYCGQEGVYRTHPNGFNRTGTWLCRVHIPLRRQHEQSMTTDNRVIDANGVVQEEVVGRHSSLPPEKKDTGGDVSVADAFAALGVAS